MGFDTGDISENHGVTPDPPARDKAFRQFMQSTRQMSDTPLTAGMIAELPDSELDDRVWLRLHSRIDMGGRDEIEALHPLVRAAMWIVAGCGLSHKSEGQDLMRVEISVSQTRPVRSPRWMPQSPPTCALVWPNSGH